MANNNQVKLTGNLGAEPRIIESEGKTFASFSIATTDSYKDKNDNWQEKETVWHNLVSFNPVTIEMLKGIKKGVRLEVSGALSYRPFEVVDGEGQVITKKEASVVAYKIEQAPLVKKG